MIFFYMCDYLRFGFGNDVQEGKCEKIFVEFVFELKWRKNRGFLVIVKWNFFVMELILLVDIVIFLVEEVDVLVSVVIFFLGGEVFFVDMVVFFVDVVIVFFKEVVVLVDEVIFVVEIFVIFLKVRFFKDRKRRRSLNEL